MGDLTYNFNREEFACNCGCGLDTVDTETLRILQEIRDHFASPITINSGCRCFTYNRDIGGARKSQHVKCRAADFSIEGVTQDEIYLYIGDTYPDVGGVGKYDDFIHLDTRSGRKARW